ncbi:Fe-S cluster assembly protein SufD [Bombilactobacillus bombi]|uniref:Fe-S cluster assembly protein SufD n=1 Tax=Bombilactobacillus bombi TaxID=1303590 RepID=UPI0015E5E8DD|nr:Fe-S cluster assembly protein SufD [Bombilactobacillus bombi]MBA1434541.1 Fe-S cluster assembly protein SufD [Bombilactobacillus bombi]
MNFNDVEFIQDLKTMSDRRHEPQWFWEQRQKALSQISSLSLPEIPQFDFYDWQLAEVIKPQLHESISSKISNDKSLNVIVQKGQTTIAIDLDQEIKNQGVIVTDIFTALQKYPDLIKKYYLNQAIRANEDRLTSYHCALMNSGIFIYIPQHVKLKQPLMIKIIQDNTFKQPLIHHLLVVAASASQVTVITQLTAQGDQKNLSNCMVEVIAQTDSKVHFSAIDELPESTMSYLNRRAVIGDRAQVEWSIGMLNSGPTIADFASELEGREAQSNAKVIAISTGSQRAGINTRVTNRGQRTIGNIVQRGILLEQSQLTFNGIGHIIHGAHGANAEQENRVLMLSDQARGDANPILLIDENDVLAGHAASVSQVDEEQMYYLMSRGIDAPTAQRLVIRGFLGPVIAGMPDNSIQRQLIDTIERKLINGQKYN